MDKADDSRNGGHGTLPTPRTVGSDGTTDTKPAERPSVPKPAIDHANTKTPGIGRQHGVKYGGRRR